MAKIPSQLCDRVVKKPFQICDGSELPKFRLKKQLINQLLFFMIDKVFINHICAQISLSFTEHICQICD